MDIKKIYGKDFEQKDYLKDIRELEKFDYTLKNFILEKANLEKLLLEGASSGFGDAPPPQFFGG